MPKVRLSAAADACASSRHHHLASAARFVRHKGEPTEPPSRAPARAPAYWQSNTVRRPVNPSSPRSGGCSKSTKPRLHGPGAKELWWPTRAAGRSPSGRDASDVADWISRQSWIDDLAPALAGAGVESGIPPLVMVGEASLAAMEAINALAALDAQREALRRLRLLRPTTTNAKTQLRCAVGMSLGKFRVSRCRGLAPRIGICVWESMSTPDAGQARNGRSGVRRRKGLGLRT
jgi:hypothetical protein